jgi:demethylmenaquinone methyltransferase/2-methoxy-6-polyprenyl-1,4-benzoquinol methylase
MNRVKRAGLDPDVKRQIWRMFNRIARRYDRLNHLLSLRRDVTWRYRMRELLPERDRVRLADIATGTGDVLLTLSEDPRVVSGVGVDMAGEMLHCAHDKVAQRRGRAPLRLVRGDASFLPLADASVDAATNAFGIRNIPDVDEALREMHRVLTPGGKALILEFSLPPWPLRCPYLLYFRRVLPWIGGAMSGDSEAYYYLNTSVEAFPYGEAFCERMRAAGFAEVRAHRQSLGIATIYEAVR